MGDCISAVAVAEKISNSISDIEETFEGTKEFKPRKICEVFRDKTVSYTDPHGDGQGISQSHGAISEHYLNLMELFLNI